MHFLTDFGQRRIPAADDRDARRLLRADLVDRGDEARQVEVGRPGDATCTPSSSAIRFMPT